jgi:hypothetical protein
MSNSFQSESSSESAESLPQHKTGTPVKIYYPAGFVLMVYNFTIQFTQRDLN